MNGKELRNELLELESFSPELQTRYHDGMKSLLVKPLSAGARIGWAFAVLMGLAFFVIFGMVAIKAPDEFPPLMRVGFIVGAVFGVVWAGLAFTVVKGGSVNRKTHGKSSLGLTFGFMVIMMTLFLLQSNRLGTSIESSVEGVKMVLHGLVFFVMFGIPSLMLLHFGRMEIGMREHMLKIELQIAELGEKQGAEDHKA